MIFSDPTTTVMAALVAAIHFPETEPNYQRFWKMDGPDEPGHDEFGWASQTSSVCIP
jgi:hypothetical protein